MIKSRGYVKILFARPLTLLQAKAFSEKALQSSFIQKDLELLRKHPDVRVVDFGLWDMLTSKIKVIKLVGYLDMLILEKKNFGTLQS